jgi:hypothetical protein
MDAHSLMRKLIEIERTLGERDEHEIRKMILAAQDGVLQLERENEELALQNAGLRLRLQGVRNSTLPLVAHSLNAGAESPETPDATDDLSGDASWGDPPSDEERTGLWRTTHFFFS